MKVTLNTDEASDQDPVAPDNPFSQEGPRLRFSLRQRFSALYDSIIHKGAVSQNSELFARGNQWFALGQPKKALKCYQEIVRTDQSHVGTWNNMGLALQQLNRYQEALDCFNKALELNPFDEEALVHKAIALLALERHDEALACCNRALDIAPDNGSLWYNKGQLLALGFLDFKAALACHEKAIELGAEEAKPMAEHCRTLIEQTAHLNN